MSTTDDIRELPLDANFPPEYMSHFDEGASDRQQGLPPRHMGQPVNSVLSFQAYMFGYFKLITKNTHLMLHKRATEIFNERDSSGLTPSQESESTVIEELLAMSPWIVIPGMGLLEKSQVTNLVNKFVTGTLDRCQRQVSKHRPLANLNADTIVFDILREVSMTS